MHRNSSGYTLVSGIFRLIIIILLFFALFRALIGSSYSLTFTSFLNYLQNSPIISTDWLKTFSLWGDSLASIPIIGGALRFLTNIVSVAAFSALGVCQIVVYIVWLARWLFV